MSKSANRLLQVPIYRGFFRNKKGPGTSFQATSFAEFFGKNFSFVVLFKLASFHYQTVFTSQVVQ